MMIIEQMLKNAPNPLLHIADVSGSALFQGDCLDIMPLIPDKSVQLILADLPYGTTACKWDSIIDLDLLWKQYKRIIKDNGAIVLTASQPFTTKLIGSNYEMFKYCWYWKKEKGTGFATSGKRPLMIVEDICVFYKKMPIYQPERKPLAKPYRHTLSIGKSKSGGKDTFKLPQINDDGSRKYKEYTHETPHQLLEISRDNSNKGVHPTQKPLELMKYLINTYSNENDMVLDNTMGSGTTCLAAKELNRKFIGIEKEANYYEIACRRCGF
jgi:site-specific DNA-methyltransferase (adenine-specific)